MNIVVCLKQILDPEMPSRDFRIDAATREADRGTAGLVMNIFCANALETALQFREQHGGKITVVAFGTSSAEEILRKALALRVDTAVLVQHDFAQRPNPWVAARVLAATIRKLGDFDIILTGRESGDWGDGQTGGLLAEEFSWPCVSFADQLNTDATKPGLVKIRRQTDQGSETVEANVPLVITVTNNDQNVPRIAKTRDVMQAFRQPLTNWSLADIGLDKQSLEECLTGTEVVELTIPIKQAHCELVTGETLEERIAGLAQRIVAVVQSA
ncbi:MAG: electron transfer flavoprotein subunit beta/FixA family protein [Pirellulaceae bacterium]|nr:electron transfer flavoprotein subunit beta/FixA family protein [Pirellulaceae bacterium]